MVMHACSLENTSHPLCGAMKFRYVTMTLENVTCERCITEINNRSTARRGPAG